MKHALVIAAGLLFFGTLSAQTFTSIPHNLPNLGYSGADWGDFDNDGDLDLAVTGTVSAGQSYTGVFRNDGGVFADINAGLIGVRSGRIKWGDYDNDGDLDLLLAGEGDPEDVLCRIEKVKTPKKLGTFMHQVIEEYLAAHPDVSPQLENRATATDFPSTLLTQLQGTTYEFR